VRVLKFLLCPLLLFMIAPAAPAHVFDSIDVSSKARGMGGAWVASGDDATAAAYNPALLMEVERVSVAATYLQPNQQSFESLTYAAFSFPSWREQKMAISVRHFGVEYQGANLETETTLAFSHAFPVLRDIHSRLYLAYGLNAYMLEFGTTQTMDLGSETTFGLDVGILGVLRERTRLGLYLHNVNEPSVGKYRSEPIPQWVSAGVSYQPYYGVVTELDVRTMRGENIEVLVGMNFEVTEMLDVRFGFQTEPSTLAGGFTLKLRSFEVDYAYSTHSALPGTHHVALRGFLGGK
jgi:hypothetical protein